MLVLCKDRKSNANSYYKVGINIAQPLFLKKKCKIILHIKKKAILLCVVSKAIKGKGLNKGPEGWVSGLNQQFAKLPIS